MKKPFVWTITLCLVALAAVLFFQNYTEVQPTAGLTTAPPKTGSDHFAFQDSQLPLSVPDDQIKPLRETHSPELERGILAELKKNPRFTKLINEKRLCLGVVDLNDPLEPHYAAINGDHMLYAASMPKIAVLLAAQDAIENGVLQETPALIKDMNRMIRYSDNAATTRIIDLLGYQYIEKTLRSPKYRLYDEQTGGGLWVGKRYARSGDTNREPLKNLSHAATAFQACRFYYNLVYGRLISRERSIDILEIMKDPGIKHKFVHTLEKLAPQATLYRKSGSWKVWHADSVLIWDNDRRYILVAIVKSPQGEQIVRQLVEPIERAMFKTHKG